MGDVSTAVFLTYRITRNTIKFLGNHNLAQLLELVLAQVLVQVRSDGRRWRKQ
jgi:hypothetical protein